jgi:hypothetical protein
VLGQIKGSGSREYLKLEFEEKRISDKVVAPDRVERLIEYLKSLPAGKYSKAEIIKSLG